MLFVCLNVSTVFTRTTTTLKALQVDNHPDQAQDSDTMKHPTKAPFDKHGIPNLPNVRQLHGHHSSQLL